MEEEVQEVSEEIVEDMWCAVAAARCGWRGWTSAIERARHYMRADNSHATSAAVLNVAVEDYCTRFELADLQEKARLVPQLRAQAQATMDGVDAALATTTVATPKTQQGMTNAGKRKRSDVLAGTNKQHLSDTEGTKGGQQDELPPPLPSPHQQQGQKRELVAERKKKKRKKKIIVSEVMSPPQQQPPPPLSPATEEAPSPTILPPTGSIGSTSLRLSSSIDGDGQVATERDDFFVQWLKCFLDSVEDDDHDQGEGATHHRKHQLIFRGFKRHG